MESEALISLFWFLVILATVNRLVLRFYYKRKFFETMKDGYEEKRIYYLGFFHATLTALVVVAIYSEYPAWLWGY